MPTIPPIAATPVTAPAPSAPAATSPPAATPPVAAAKPAAPAAPTTGAATKLAPGVAELVQATGAIDATWTASARQAQAAVAALGANAKPDAELTSSITRLGFIGTVLGEGIPKDAAPVTLAKGADPKAAVLDAEKSLHSAIAAAVKAADTVGNALPKDAPKESIEAFLASQERITDALYAVKFSLRFAPPPAAPAAGTAAPAAPAAGAPAPTTTAAPAPTTTTPATTAAPTATTAPAAATTS